MTTPPDAPTEWYRDAVIYSLHVKSFMDSNGDGVGDFAGLTQRLDYLHDLGVTALWLLPFYPSPGRDDGYDIADYTDINPAYGNLRQFKRFVREAHARDMKVITELVINHTSDQHPWFKRAVSSPPGSSYRDWYVWTDDPGQWPEVRIIFQDFETSNWTWHPEAQQYYWHRFYHHQPDLNFDNPDVRQAVKDALDRWCEMGVDAFRLDAIPYLFERDGTNGENLPETHEFLRELRTHLDANWDDRMFLAEANQWPEDAAAYFGDSDECQMNFHFPLMPRLFMAVSQEDRFPIIDILQQTPDVPDGCQWALFLRNHDELTLEMVTDEERDFMYRAYAHDPRMRINLGIRRRLAPLLDADRRLIELMNSLLLSMPGTPVIYYGDEIGMGDNIYLGDRDGVRTPMQWSADRNAGFSAANPQRLFLPVVIDPEYHYETVNVEWQLQNPRSLLWWMKRILALRKRHTGVFGRGGIEFVETGNQKVLAYVRTPPEGDQGEDDHGPPVLVVANLSRHAQACQLELPDHAGDTPIEMFGGTSFPPFGEQRYPLTLGSYQFYWFTIERSPSRFSMSRLREHPIPEPDHDEGDHRPAVTSSGSWRALLRGRGLARLEAALPDVLVRRRWFGGKARPIRATAVTDVVPLGAKTDPTLHVLVVRVEYVDGEPEHYAVPIAFAEGEDAGRIDATDPDAVLLEVRGRGADAQSGIIYDALHRPEAAALLLETVARQRRARGTHGEVVGRRDRSLGTTAHLGQLEPSLLRVEQSNTSVVFGRELLMKVVRKVEPGVSPDVEIGRHLAGRIDHVPELLGTLDHESEDAGPRTLAVVHRFIPNEGDAWVYTLDELERFCERVLAEGDGPRPRLPGERDTVPALARRTVPEEVHDMVGPFLGAMQLLGQRTAELHIALAESDDDPDFAPEPFTRLYQRSVYQSMRNALRRGLQTCREQLPALTDDTARAEVTELVGREHDILERIRSLSDTRIHTVRTRIHGDFHLGQVLCTGRDFVLIDFEGEPARPLGERRIKRSPLRDVAGMLRSFQYASFSALQFQVERGSVEIGARDHDELHERLQLWNRWVSAAYLGAYLRTAENEPFVPDDPAETAILLDAFSLEKAMYELIYEMNNRPEWVHIPLTGIAEILGRP